jgi:hypothetical protein
MTRAGVICPRFEGNIGAFSRHDLETGREDTDDRVSPVVQPYRVADNVWVAAKAILPQRMIEDDAAGRARLIFIFGENPTVERIHAHDLEIAE